MSRATEDDRASPRERALVGLNVGKVATPVRAPRLADVAVATLVDRSRGDLVSPFDARYVALKPSELEPYVAGLVEAVDIDVLDAVLAISESGVVPAYAFAAVSGLPLVVATEVDAELPQAIAFAAGHDGATGLSRTRRVYPLSRGDRVVIVESHTLTGDSVLSCVGALRAEGIVCHRLATVLAADDDGLQARLSNADIEMSAAALIPGAITRLLYRDGEPPDRSV